MLPVESDRFKAKCQLGKIYTVIEKTKNIKEPRLHNGHAFILSQRSYFLTTGEKVNKITDESYLLIDEKKIIVKKNPFPNKQFILDIKTLFDGLKNLALCIAMVLALPNVQKIIALAYDSHVFIVGVNWASITAIATLTVYNLIWLFSSMESKTKNRFIDITSIIITIAVIVIIVGYMGSSVYPELILSPVGHASIASHFLIKAS